ncbi:antirestriction protein ArdA [uncultured Oscillibacter sp.]|uniref:antirestriction protein ArdA n=2 Tax=uncultured Oscillibacter sp. TaxID=876091 RepID=UPI002635AFCC|nr:antirestriction protein ArdA [uncultured Oscillibacter sp.]
MNQGKYNEDRLVGAPLKFPTTTEAVQNLLKQIGIDGIRYEEIFIASYDGPMPQLHKHLGEYESIDELNHLACLLSELNEYELEVFEAVMDSGEYTGSVKDLINLAQNLDDYNFYSDIHTEEELGRMYIQELEAVPVPEHLIDYIDYEAYGRDVRINEDGHLAPGGYVVGGGSFVEHYHGIEDIPDEHRVFSMPKVPIREQMAAYQEMAKQAPPPAERPVPKADREER